MRVLSFIPTLLFAATSLVAAAPTPATSDATRAVAAYASTDDVSAPSTPSVQNVYNIIVSATNQMEPLCTQLTSTTQGSSPDQDAIINLVGQINDILTTTITQLKLVIDAVDWTSADVNSLRHVVYSFFVLVFSALNALVPCVRGVVHETDNAVYTAVGNLITTTYHFVDCVKEFVGGTLAGTVGPLVGLTSGIISSLAFIMGISLP